MIKLKSSNRVLVANAQYAYLTQNYASGVSTINVTHSEPFSAEDIILIGEFGHKDAEILKVKSISSTGDIVLKTTADVDTSTGHAHTESTKVAVLPYDQVRFYWTAAAGTIADEDPTFDTDTPLTDWTALDPSSFYSVYEDTANTTGFGWFKYRNSETTGTTQESNPIPYAGFVGHTVQAIFEDFDSLLNVNELKLVTMKDKFSWLNESLSVVKKRLNLTNTEYTVSSSQTISIVSGTSEYELPADFSDLVQIVDENDDDIDNIALNQILSYSGNAVKYYIRGRYIGFVPAPTSSATYTYTYRAKASTVSSLSTYINLPDDMFYSIKDWMLYRAYTKFSNPLAATYYISFNASLDLSVQSSVKRTANLDTFGLSNEANT